MRKIILFLLLFFFANALVQAQFTNEFVTYSTTNTPVFSGNNFKCVGVGKGNRIWAGTQYQGLYWFDTARKAWTKSSQLTNVFINHIQTDRDGGVWIAQSGISGQSGGGSNIAGGVNYFPDTTDAGMQYYSNANFLSSRNVRSIHVDKENAAPGDIRRVWAAQATYITSGNTTAGGISKWQTISSGNFQKNYLGLQVFPNTNVVSSGTPSCYSVCGDRQEVWVGTETNYLIASGSTSQILRYDAITGQLLGGYDAKGEFDNTRLFYADQARKYINTSTQNVLPAGFRATAMFIDGEGRRWVGLRSGGVVVKIGDTWRNVNMPTIFPAGTTINFNAITSDEFGYIYFGTTNGVVVFDNGGDVGDTTFFKRFTTVDSLPSNNITGVAYDKAGGRMVLTSDAGVTFWKFKYKIKVDMVWDYSYPERISQPIGVAADGVSRIYLKIQKRSDTLPNIKTLAVTWKNFSTADSSTRGRLKKANIIDKYSEEANDASFNDILFTDADFRPGAPGEKWLWYVAPSNFCADTTSRYFNLSRRFDTLIMVATYTNNTKDTQEYKIAVVRPPTLFVHGLASDPNAWSGVSHLYFGKWQTYLNSPLFVYKRALTMDPIGMFQKNARQLLGGDLNSIRYEGDKYNTLQGNISLMRNTRRYAANQVDYVCHSMGGIMIRSAIGMHPNKFFSKDGDPYKYKTYGKGFTHKIITMNTPHNGAPIADVFDEYIPKAEGPMKVALNTLYYYLGSPQLLGGLLMPVGGGGATGSFRATDAVNNLQVTKKRGGVPMLATPAKYHMIMSIMNWTKYSQYLGNIDYGLSKIYKLLIEIQYAQTYDNEVFDFATAERRRASLRNMLAQETEVCFATFLDSMSARRKYDNYVAQSDLVVPAKSQTAQQDEVTSPHISKFIGNDSLRIKVPIPIVYSLFAEPYYIYREVVIVGVNGNHSAITSRQDAGQRLFQLLNSDVNSAYFGREIPANNDPETPFNLRQAGAANEQARPTAAPVFVTTYDTTKIRIDAPVRNGASWADSTVVVKFRVKDTARLAYVTIRFQDSDSFRLRKTLAQQSMSIYVNPVYLFDGKITATAVYENAAKTGLNYYVDTLSVALSNLAPLQGFRVKEEVAEVRAGQPYFPVYEAQYNDQWITLSYADPAIQATVDSVNVVSFDAVRKSFSALQEGAAIANFTYKGFADSMVLRTYLPYDAGCFNKTIAGGSFKNPAIWSKGIVPDVCDSVLISTGHSVTLDTSLTIRALRINTGATLTLSRATDTLQIGELDEGFSMLDQYGILNISNGGIFLNGRIKFNSSSSFNMSGGKLTIDANKNTKEMSIPDGLPVFEAATGMSTFNFSNGTLQINNPPFGAASQTISCPYDFGINSTLVLGDPRSKSQSNNADGFGGLSFPNRIGKLIVNTGNNTGNRKFVNKKALTVRGSAQVKPGSSVLVQAPLTVTP